MLKIQDFINNKELYKVDYNYQRPNEAWSYDDKQCLIDTILNDEPMPLFFFNYNADTEQFFIVDGQQRLNCIRQFYDNKIKLSKKHSGLENHGKTFNGENSIRGSDPMELPLLKAVHIGFPHLHMQTHFLGFRVPLAWPLVHLKHCCPPLLNLSAWWETIRHSLS